MMHLPLSLQHSELKLPHTARPNTARPNTARSVTPKLAGSSTPHEATAAAASAPFAENIVQAVPETDLQAAAVAALPPATPPANDVFIAAVPNPVAEGVEQAQAIAGQQIEPICQNVKKTAQDSLNYVGGLANEASRQLNDKVGAGLQQATQKTGELLQPVTQAAGEIFSELGQAGTEQVEQVLQSGERWINTYVPTPREFARGLSELAGDAAAYAQNCLKQGCQALRECIPQSLYYPQKWPPEQSSLPRDV